MQEQNELKRGVIFPINFLTCLVPTKTTSLF